MIKNILILLATFSLVFAAWPPALASTASSAVEIKLDTPAMSLPGDNTTISVTGSVSFSDYLKDAPKRIDVDLSQQTLSYYYGDYLVHTIKISSGIAALPTPTGTFYIESKIPVKEYVGRNLDGTYYDFPNTLWNMRFSDLGYFIHGAYWHHNFGHPMSHGCINVSYTDMPELYNFASIGTPVVIHQ